MYRVKSYRFWLTNQPLILNLGLFFGNRIDHETFVPQTFKKTLPGQISYSAGLRGKEQIALE